MNIGKIISGFLCCLLLQHLAVGQDALPQKTIEVTSAFKPTLRTPAKLAFTAAPAIQDSNRTVAPYQVPVQNLAFGYTPSALKPLAFSDTVQHGTQKAWLKLGYGNFATPFFNGVVAFGDGKKTTGSVNANFLSQKGKLPHQQYLQYGIGANAFVNLNPRQQFSVKGGVDGFTTYRYGYRPETLVFNKKQIRQQFTDVHAAVGLNNAKNPTAPLYYDTQLGVHLFSDNINGKESTVHFKMPFEKQFSNKVQLQLGVAGMLNQFKSDTIDVSNHLFLLNAGVQFLASENLRFKVGLVPSWSSKEFKVLPDLQAELLVNNQKVIVEAGLKGYYNEQTYRGLTRINPWIAQPDTLNNTRNTEFYGAIKTAIGTQVSFRVKVGFVTMANVPLFVNDKGDGKTFRTIFEPKMNNVAIASELIWHIGDKIDWYNSLNVNAYGNFSQAEKAYGLLPVTFNSTLRAQLAKGLAAKVDLYNFAAAWYRSSAGVANKGQSGIDLNAGIEYALHKKVALWLQFNNILNSTYQRWHQYQVLGFQVLGGVVIQL
ncbi:MAG: hypothetical protein EAY75_08725 [Bacteroidetes bacterium]|nr:MAG: hypothetical protein EAY75_08725 [Bacteroidota bacterium]